MCGIAGVLTLTPNQLPSLDGLRRMVTVLTHRGPDEEGFYVNGPVGLAHRRLSIIDLASGHQPMESPDGQVCVVFNGEVYNYLELKAELAQQGHVFRTTSDTEVLLALYQQYGLDAFAKVNGMLACAFWDQRTRQLVLVRDRFGKKPLFYYADAQRLVFGSEIKAILAYGGIQRQVNLAALHEYLTHNFIVGNQSIFQGIHRLPPAHVLVVRNGQTRTFPYWQLQFTPQPTPPPEEEVAEHLADLLRQAVKRRLMSEVPLGAFLSGGIDSSTVVALMAQLSDRPVRTFAVGFDEADYSELEDARTVAQHLGTDHHEMVVRPAALDVLPKLVRHFDEPFGDSSAVPTYYVCQAARQHLTVALSGDGGDEVFAGYLRYRKLAQFQRMARLPGWIRHQLLQPLTGILPFTWPGWNYLYAMGRMNSSGLPTGLGLYPYIQAHLYSSEFTHALRGCDAFAETEKILGNSAHLDPISRYQHLDTLQYLPAAILTKVDRMSMANSLEVRSPLLDYTIVEYMATLPVTFKMRSEVSKYILRKLCERWLPPATLRKKKQGFGIPKGKWFQQELRTFAEDVLLDRKTLARSYFRKESLRRLLDHHATGRRDYGSWIWCLIVLELWHRLFLDKENDGLLTADGWKKTDDGRLATDGN